jgi:hypothetical protein
MPSDTLPEDLYHDTDVGGLMGILTTANLWATHVSFLNDSREVLHGAAETARYLGVMWDEIAGAPEKIPE